MSSLWSSVASLAQRFAGWLSWRRPVLPDAPPVVRTFVEIDPIAPPVIVPEIVPPQYLTPLPPIAPTPKRVASRARDGSSNFYHLEDLLEQLPTCRRLLRKLRQLDEDAYDYHARVGARVLPKEALMDRSAGVDFVNRLPAAGMIFLPDRHDEEGSATFLYFQKLKKLSHDMAKIPGVTALYRVTVAWIANGKQVLGYKYAIAMIGREAHIVAERFEERQHLPRGGSVVHSRWGVPPMLEIHFKDRKEKMGEEFDHSDISSFALFPLSCAAQYYTASLDEFLVRAERNAVSVSFGVALGRTPYFFKDRNTEVAADGKKKRIFHAVAGHDRTLRSGKVVSVPAHYRGERRFLWSGESITITPPERSARLLDLPAAIEAPELERPTSAYLGAAETGRRIRSHIERDIVKAA